MRTQRDLATHPNMVGVRIIVIFSSPLREYSDTGHIPYGSRNVFDASRHRVGLVDFSKIQSFIWTVVKSPRTWEFAGLPD